MVQPRKNNPKVDFRLTKQRMVILEYVRKDSAHPSVEKIYHNVKSKLPRLSLATVYRNLAFLRDHGYVKELVIDKIARFEARVDSHAHLVCEGCHRIIDVDDTTLTAELKRLAHDAKFYTRYDHLEVRGFCRSCQKRTSPRNQAPELFCMACGSLLDDLAKDAPVCKSCCFKTNCSYYGPKKNSKTS